MRDRTGTGRNRLAADTRAVSVTVGYVLTLAIGAVLLSGVIIGVGGVIDSQTDRAIRGDLAVVGQNTVANLESADRLARAAEEGRPDSTGAVNVSVDVDLPKRVAGIPYRIAIGNDTAELRTDNPDASVEIAHTATLTVAQTSVRGGPIRIRYAVPDGDPGPGTLEVSER